GRGDPVAAGGILSPQRSRRQRHRSNGPPEATSGAATAPSTFPKKASQYGFVASSSCAVLASGLAVSDQMTFLDEMELLPFCLLVPRTGGLTQGGENAGSVPDDRCAASGVPFNRRHPMATPSDDVVGKLNSFLRGEISAVETYRQALDKITDPA